MMANQADKLFPTAAFHLERLLQAAAVTLQVCLLVREFEVTFKFLLSGWPLPVCWSPFPFLPRLPLLHRLLSHSNLLPLLVLVGHPLLN